MASEWIHNTLGDVLTLQRGFDLPQTKRKPGPFPVIASTGPVGTHAQAMVEGPGVVIGRSGSIGGGQYIKSSFWPLNTTLWVKDFKKNDRRFCYYLLKSLDLASFNAGSGVPTLNRNHIHPLPVQIPEDVMEQRAIAHILGTLDDKIELNRKINETMEGIARVIFKSWFVDFGPVRAKAEGRDPGIPQPLADFFPDRFEDSEMGEIPAGWDVLELSELSVIKGGRQLSTEECRSVGQFPVFGANGIMGYTDRASHNGFVIAFGRVGAYCGSVHWSYGGAWINNNASSVVPIRWPEFILQSMLNADFEGMRMGSAQPFIPNSSLARLQLVRASDEVLDSFCSVVRSLRLKEQALENESCTIAALCNTLLPKLISGELRVPESEHFIERAG